MARLRIALATVPLIAIGAIMLVPDTRAGKDAPAPVRSGPAIFVITDQEGYGTGECLERPGGCGQIIADSFCESKGFRMASSYRRAEPDEVTGSIVSERRPAPRDPAAYIVACR